jgi:hypothetical protein
LRELARLDDFARAQPGVTQVQSIIGPLVLVSNAMGAGARLPMTRGQATNLYFFLQGQPEVRSLLADDRKEALVHVRIAGHVDEVVAALEGYARGRLASAHGWPTRDDVADELGFILTGVLRRPNLAALHHAAQTIAAPRDDDEELLRKEDELGLAAVTTPDAPELKLASKAVVELAVERRSPGWRDLWRNAAVHPDDADLAIGNLEQALADARRQLGLSRAVRVIMDASGVGEVPAPVRERVARAADDLFGPEDGAVATTKLIAQVAGEPILDRGFSAAVARNQLLSLGVSIVLVFLFLLGLFRRPWIALVCLAPAMLTLICQSGVMGMSRTSIDLGTSLVAGIATGAGSDFAMHYLWYLRRQGAHPDDVTRTVGPIMSLSVALVAVGFFVLGLGRSPVMHLFGGMAGSAMAISALFTCILLPAALRGRKV